MPHRILSSCSRNIRPFDSARTRSCCSGCDGTPSIEDGIGGQVAFEIETDLEGTERWKDVYVEYTPSDALHVRAGKFVIPFGFERTTSIDILDFAYRTMASSNLAPARDRGVMLYGALKSRKLTYDAGFFEDGRTLAGRLVARPGGLEIGAAVMTGDLVEEIGALRGQSALGHTFFTGPAPESGRRRRTTVFGAYRAGPAAVKSEYITARDRRDDGVAENGAAGWYAGATARARAHTFGVTWQPIRFFRVQYNAVRDILPSRRLWTRVLRFHLTI